MRRAMKRQVRPAIAFSIARSLGAPSCGASALASVFVGFNAPDESLAWSSSSLHTTDLTGRKGVARPRPDYGDELHLPMATGEMSRAARSDRPLYARNQH